MLLKPNNSRQLSQINSTQALGTQQPPHIKCVKHAIIKFTANDTRVYNASITKGFSHGKYSFQFKCFRQNIWNVLSLFIHIWAQVDRRTLGQHIYKRISCHKIVKKRQEKMKCWGSVKCSQLKARQISLRWLIWAALRKMLIDLFSRHN